MKHLVKGHSIYQIDIFSDIVDNILL